MTTDQSPKQSAKPEVEATNKGKKKVVDKDKENEEAPIAMVVTDNAYSQLQNIPEFMIINYKVYSSWKEIPVIAEMTEQSYK